MHENKERTQSKVAMAAYETCAVIGFVLLVCVPNAMENGTIMSGLLPLVLSGVFFGAAHVIGLVYR